MVEGGVVEEARAAWTAPHSHTAAQILGLEEFATLPLDEAIERVTGATRRLARYQRKWLRRMPGVVTLDGDRPAEEISDEIVTLEGAREHLPRH